MATHNYDPRDSYLGSGTAYPPKLIPTIGTETADVVVVDVGTNDFFRGTPTEAAFVDSRALLTSVRARYARLSSTSPSAHARRHIRSLSPRSDARRWLERGAAAANDGDRNLS